MEKISVTLQNKDLIEEIIEKNPDLQVRIHNSIIDSITKRMTKSICNLPEVQNKIEYEQKRYEEGILKQMCEPGNFGYGYKLKSEYAKKISDFINQKIKDEIYDKITQLINDECEKEFSRVQYRVENAALIQAAKIESFDAEKYMKEKIDEEIKRRLDMVMKG